MRAINKIIIHCSATPEGHDYTAADIDSWHKARGWRCIGYHYAMLENESSCNDAKWAKVLQRIMVDKTERHFDIDLSALKEMAGKKDQEIAAMVAKEAESSAPKDKTNNKTTNYENPS